MGLALSVQHHLDRKAIPYQVRLHRRAVRASDIASVSNISEDNLAKGVLLKGRDGYLLAILPASCQVQIEAVSDWLKQPVCLATEDEVSLIFEDCEAGCAPPVADAYGLPAVLDDRLEGFDDVYFEGGDHCTLVRLRGRDFHNLMVGVPQAHIGVRAH